jgi:hypothetical protein
MTISRASASCSSLISPAQQIGIVGELHFLGDLRLRVGDRSDQVAAPDRELHRHVAAPVLAIDRRRSFHAGDRCELAERDIIAVRGLHGDLADRLDIGSVGFLKTDR